MKQKIPGAKWTSGRLEKIAFSSQVCCCLPKIKNVVDILSRANKSLGEGQQLFRCAWLCSLPFQVRNSPFMLETYCIQLNATRELPMDTAPHFHLSLSDMCMYLTWKACWKEKYVVKVFQQLGRKLRLSRHYSLTLDGTAAVLNLLKWNLPESFAATSFYGITVWNCVNWDIHTGFWF